VFALGEFDPDGETSGTVVNISFDIEQSPENKETWNAFLSIESNIDKSENPPYSFKLEAMGLFTCSADVDEKAFRGNAFQMLGGSMRERLSMLTAAGPWPAFLLGAMPMSKAWETMVTGEPEA